MELSKLLKSTSLFIFSSISLIFNCSTVNKGKFLCIRPLIFFSNRPQNAFLFNIYLFLLGNISIYDINNTMKTNQTLETALEKNKPVTILGNADDILAIGSRVLKH